MHFRSTAPVVLTEDAKELAIDVGVEAVQSVEQATQAGESFFLARLNPRSDSRIRN